MRVMEIEISGSPYERGLQYGKSCKGLIDVCISNYQQYIPRYWYGLECGVQISDGI